MPLDPERSLAAALIARLRAEPALADLQGRVYDEPPSRPDYPYLSIGRSQTRLLAGEVEEGMEHVLTLTVVSRYGGAEEAKRLSAAAGEALDDQPLTLTDHRLVGMRVAFKDVFRASDWRSVYGVIRLRAVTEPLPA
jgi:hypothetical protein